MKRAKIDDGRSVFSEAGPGGAGSASVERPLAVVGRDVVRFADVCKSYDGRTNIVSNLSLEVRRGEFLTMLGPSGSGKTTCLMMLAGFESVSAGEIYLNDRPISRVPPNKRGIGMVFQNYALFPHMTVAENLAFPLQVRKVDRSEIDRKVMRSLEMVRLASMAGRLPGQLSGGQQQRVALARALVFEPELVLMDEPLGALDKNLREEMQYEIKAIHQRLQVSVVYVTHDQTEALTMSDRIAVFEGGAIQQLSEPGTLYENPSNAFVANFIGENNLLPGTVERCDSGYCSVRIDGAEAVLTARRGAGLAAGDRTVVSVRPERISLVPSADMQRNAINATVNDVVLLGDQLRIRLDANGTMVTLKSPNVANANMPRNGEKIRLYCRADDCRAFEVQG